MDAYFWPHFCLVSSLQHFCMSNRDCGIQWQHWQVQGYQHWGYCLLSRFSVHPPCLVSTILITMWQISNFIKEVHVNMSVCDEDMMWLETACTGNEVQWSYFLLDILWPVHHARKKKLVSANSSHLKWTGNILCHQLLLVRQQRVLCWCSSISCPTSNVLKSLNLTLLAHAGLFWCFLNPLNSPQDL